MIYRVDVEIAAPVLDTEVTERVVDAIENLVPGADVERAAGEVRAEGHSLDHFSDLLHRQEILDSARGEFFGDRQGDVFSFDLKKQAAFEGVVNFAVGEPDELGERAGPSCRRACRCCSRNRSMTTTTNSYRIHTAIYIHDGGHKNGCSKRNSV